MTAGDAAGVWSRPGLTPGYAPDCVALDVDGVLIDTEGSFREVTRITVAALQRLLGRDAVWTPSVADITTLKHAGGFNDDVDCSIALAAIGAAGRGRELAQICSAVEAAGGGLPALRQVAPELPRMSGRLALRVFNEHYWGSDDFAEHFGAPAEHAVGVVGLREAERALVGADLPQRLRQSGVPSVALITGRTPRELDAALLMLAWERDDLDVIVTGDQVRKPDPVCIERVVAATGATRLVMVGDTRDDWELVRRHRAAHPGGAELRGVVVGDRSTTEPLRRLGADATLERTADLPELLRRWATRG